MEDTTFKNIEVGDLVVRRGRHSGDVRFVEDVFYSTNLDDLHVLLVNGVEDESFEGERGVNRFNEEWRLLAKAKDLIEEEKPVKEVVKVFRERIIYSHPKSLNTFTIHKRESEDNPDEYIVEPTMEIYSSLEEMIGKYEEVRDSLVEKFPKEIYEVVEMQSPTMPILKYKGCGISISYHSVGSYYTAVLTPPMFGSLIHLHVWLCGLIDKLKELLEEDN